MKGGLARMPAVVQKVSCDALRPVALRIGLIRLLGSPGAGRPFGLSNLGRDQQREQRVLSNAAPITAPAPEYTKATEALNDYLLHKNGLVD